MRHLLQRCAKTIALLAETLRGDSFRETSLAKRLLGVLARLSRHHLAQEAIAASCFVDWAAKVCTHEVCCLTFLTISFFFKDGPTKIFAAGQNVAKTEVFPSVGYQLNRLRTMMVKAASTVPESISLIVVENEGKSGILLPRPLRPSLSPPTCVVEKKDEGQEEKTMVHTKGTKEKFTERGKHVCLLSKLRPEQKTFRICISVPACGANSLGKSYAP